MKTSLSIFFLTAFTLSVSAQSRQGQGESPSPTPNRPQPVKQISWMTKPSTPASRSQFASNKPTTLNRLSQSEHARQYAADALDRAAADARRMSGQGYDCILQQNGGMTCYRQPNMDGPMSYPGQEVIDNPGVYSGSGAGRNNPAMQSIRNTGPIPLGMWNVSRVAQTLTNQQGVTRPHRNVLHLQPSPGTQTYGRDRFRLHGDYASTDSRHGTASAGCPIVPPTTRAILANMIQQGGQVRLEVRPGKSSQK